jgi:endo-1,4-beta-xylanase
MEIKTSLLNCVRKLVYWLDDHIYFDYQNIRRSKDLETLKDAYSGKFQVGAGIGASVFSGIDRAAVRILRREFNSITPEYCMKSIYIQPHSGVFNFKEVDKFVKFGERNRMTIIGHNLIWGLKVPLWFFVDENGNEVSKEELINRMKNHITTIVSRYKGQIKAWDVVNEVFNQDGGYINSKFYKIIGEDHVKLAFEFARAADPDCEFYYNDACLPNEKKRNAVVKMVKQLQDTGVKVDGIGIEGHFSLIYPDINELEKSILAFSELGCKVNITEFDISVLPVFNPDIDPNIALSVKYKQYMNPYKEGLPEEVANKLYKRYKEFFKLFLKHQDKINLVTLWGITDNVSNKNEAPIPGRTDYPLLFDRNYQAKPVVRELIEMAIQSNKK